jgi:hypothetical protein
MWKGENVIMNQSAFDPIPWKVADELCLAIREQAEVNWKTAAARWCWNCQQATGGDMNKRGFMRSPGNRGCTLINARYATTRLES